MQTKRSTKPNSKFHQLTNGLASKKKLLSTGTIVAFVISATPLLFYLYQLFPTSEYIDTIFGRFNSSYYQDIQILVWVVFNKITPLILLLIWFFTCKHWWYHALLIPIIVIAYQTITAINGDVRFFDMDDIFFLIPVIALVAAFSYSIRIKIFDRLYGVDLDEDLKRVRWNGKIVKVPANSPLNLEEVGDDEIDDDDDDDDDKEPMWMA